MNHFKAGRLVAPDGRGFADVTSLSFDGLVFYDHVGCFKDADREGVNFVLADSLQEAGQKSRPNDLIFQRLWVGKFDDLGAIICAVKPREILFVGALGFLSVISINIGLRQYFSLTRMSGRTSTHPAIAHSLRMRSLSLLTANGWATVLVAGNVLGRLLKPKAMAASSMISHSWRMSGRVIGISTAKVSGSVFDTVASRDIRQSSLEISPADKFVPVHELI